MSCSRGTTSKFVRTEIDSIDPLSRGASSSGGAFVGDHLVVALGAEPRPDLVPGLAEHGHESGRSPASRRGRGAAARFGGGRLLVLIAGAPYPCPPAPYECAIHLHEHLQARGLRERTELSVATLQPLLMPNAGREGSAWMGDQLVERGISFHVGAKTERVEAGRVMLAGSELPFDLLIAVPPHRAPTVVASSGLAAEHGWIGVDPGRSRHRTNASTPSETWTNPAANGLPLPKAGVMAELHGTRVARAIAAELLGEAPPELFDGRGYCRIELGPGAAALVKGDWYAEPEPVVSIAGPSAAHAAEKEAFETEHLARWFGA